MDRRQTRRFDRIVCGLEHFLLVRLHQTDKFVACRARPSVRSPSSTRHCADPRLFPGGFHGRDVLHFNFSEAIYPEAEIEELVVQALFEFVPPLEGMWTAVSPDRVRFDLAEPPSTRPELDRQVGEINER